MKFKDVKVNDLLLVEHSGWDKSYYKGTVTKVTGTRFTVSYDNREQQFTKQGHEYPRQTGYSRVYTHIKPLTEEGELLIKKYRLANKARHLAGKLGDIFGNGNFRANISDIDLSVDELDESIQMLEATYERFKKYGSKE